MLPRTGAQLDGKHAVVLGRSNVVVRALSLAKTPRPHLLQGPPCQRALTRPSSMHTINTRFLGPASVAAAAARERHGDGLPLAHRQPCRHCKQPVGHGHGSRASRIGT